MPDGAENLDAIDGWQGEVEDDDVVRLRGRGGEALVAAQDGSDRVASFGERFGYELGDLLFVFDE